MAPVRRASCRARRRGHGSPGLAATAAAASRSRLDSGVRVGHVDLAHTVEGSRVEVGGLQLASERDVRQARTDEVALGGAGNAPLFRDASDGRVAVVLGHLRGLDIEEALSRCGDEGAELHDRRQPFRGGAPPRTPSPDSLPGPTRRDTASVGLPAGWRLSIQSRTTAFNPGLDSAVTKRMGGAVVARVAEQPEPVDTHATRTAADHLDAAPAVTQAGARPDHVVTHVADARVPDPLQRRMRWIFGTAAALVATLVVSLTLRPLGSYVNLVDGWGEAAFELSMGALCIARFYEESWRTSTSVARPFPLIVGMACLAWGLGDAMLALESVGGVQPPTPSPADTFYACFFPICFLGLALLIRRGNRSSLMATSLDGLVAGFGVAAISAAVLVAAIADKTGGSPLATATNLAYPLGAVLLLALAVGGLAALPQGFRPFFAIVCIALAMNAFGNFVSLLEPTSRFGYVSHGATWPLSLALVALAVWVLPATLENPGTDKMAGFGLPAFGAAIGVTILFVGSFGHTGKPAIALATVTLLVAGVRLGLTLREAHSLKTARFRSLIDKTWDLIAVVESDLRIAYVTPSSAAGLGLSTGNARRHVVHRACAPRRLAHGHRTPDRS